MSMNESSSRPDEREEHPRLFRNLVALRLEQRDAKAKLCSRSQLPRLVSRCRPAPLLRLMRRQFADRRGFPRHLSLLQRTLASTGLSALGCTSLVAGGAFVLVSGEEKKIAERRADPANASRLGFTAEEVENMEEMADLNTRVI